MYATRSAQATAADAVQVYFSVFFLLAIIIFCVGRIDFRRSRYYSNRYVEATNVLLHQFKFELKGMGEYIEHVCHWSWRGGF
jgi:hypothetical protein